MGRRKGAGIAVVAAALAVVPWRLVCERDRVMGVEVSHLQGRSDWLTGKPSEPDVAWFYGAPYPADWVLYPSKEAVPLPRDAAAFAAFTATLPPKLARADLWAWWRGSRYGKAENRPQMPPPRYGEESRYEKYAETGQARGEPALVPYQPNEQEAAEYRRRDELWDAKVAFMRERDPANGWPPLLMAMREIREATREIEVDDPDAAQDGRPPGKVTRWRVEDSARAEKAAQLLHEAVRRPRFDQALDEWMRVEFTRLGGRPTTWQDTIRMWWTLTRAPPMHLNWMRDFARRMTGEIERRAALADPGDGLDAAAVARDVQTMALRSMARMDFLIEVLVAYGVVASVSQNGDRVLRAAGREAEAVDLANRGRRIMWRFVIPRAMRGVRARREAAANPAARPSFQSGFLEDDPTLIAEAERLLDDPASGAQGGEGEIPSGQMGALGRMVVPAPARTVYAPEIRPTPRAIRNSARFEYYGAARVFALRWLGGIWLFLVGWTLWTLAVAGMGRIKRPARRDIGWPGAGWIAGASAAFALPAFGAPLLMAYYPGSFLAHWSPPALAAGKFPHDMGMWLTGFWLAWGALAGWNALVWLADRDTRRAAAAGDAADAVCRRWHSGVFRWGRRGIGWGLLLSPITLMAGWGVIGFGPGFFHMYGAALLLLLPAGLMLVFHMIALAGGTPTRALGWARGRRILVGLAGGVLGGLVGFALLGGLETRAAAGDTIIIPDTMDGMVAVTPPEGRLVALCRRDARRLLAEEGIAPSMD